MVKRIVQINVEPADPRNLNLRELLKIERECFTVEAFTMEQLISLLKNPTAIGLLAKINEEVAGFVIGLIENYGKTQVGHVYTIDVTFKHRRMGVGVKLLNEIEKAFLKRGAETVFLEVRVDNHAARRLYRKQGYVEIESLGDYYSTGIHGLRLKKQLKPESHSPSEL